MEDKKASLSVQKASLLVEGGNVATVQKHTSPNKKEKRQARKLQEEADMLEQEKIVAQAEEDLKQAAMLSRKRKRSAENTMTGSGAVEGNLGARKNCCPGCTGLEGTGQTLVQTKTRGRRNGHPSSCRKESSSSHSTYLATHPKHSLRGGGGRRPVAIQKEN